MAKAGGRAGWPIIRRGVVTPGRRMRGLSLGGGEPNSPLDSRTFVLYNMAVRLTAQGRLQNDPNLSSCTLHWASPPLEDWNGGYSFRFVPRNDRARWHQATMAHAEPPRARRRARPAARRSEQPIDLPARPRAIKYLLGENDHRLALYTLPPRRHVAQIDDINTIRL